MKILLLGSKPDAQIPPNLDLVAYINGSIGDASGINLPAIHIFGDSIFYWDIELAKLNMDFMQSKTVLKSYIIQYRNVDLLLKLSQINYQYNEVELIPRKIKGKIEYKKLGFRYFLFLIISKKFSLKEKYHVLKWFIETGELKLSTGAFALLLLLKAYPNDEIIISGIGFGPEEYSYYKIPTNLRRAHFTNDYFAFKTLISCGSLKNVSTTEEDLNRLFGIPFYES